MADYELANALVNRLNQAEMTIHRAVVALLRGQPVPDRPFAAVDGVVRDHHGLLWCRCLGREAEHEARAEAARLNDAYRLGRAAAEADAEQ